MFVGKYFLALRRKVRGRACIQLSLSLYVLLLCVFAAVCFAAAAAALFLGSIRTELSYVCVLCVVRCVRCVEGYRQCYGDGLCRVWH